MIQELSRILLLRLDQKLLALDHIELLCDINSILLLLLLDAELSSLLLHFPEVFHLLFEAALRVVLIVLFLELRVVRVVLVGKARNRQARRPAVAHV